MRIYQNGRAKLLLKLDIKNEAIRRRTRVINIVWEDEWSVAESLWIKADPAVDVNLLKN